MKFLDIIIFVFIHAEVFPTKICQFSVILFPFSLPEIDLVFAIRGCIERALSKPKHPPPYTSLNFQMITHSPVISQIF